MITLKYEIDIAAPRETIWKNLWDDEMYNKWTTPFSPTSRVKAEWIEGGEVLFHDGTECGMVSVIERLDAPSVMIFRHKGMIENGVTSWFGEDTEWKEALESYRLEETATGTRLFVEVETADNFVKFMDEKFPQALAIVKELSE